MLPTLSRAFLALGDALALLWVEYSHSDLGGTLCHLGQYLRRWNPVGGWFYPHCSEVPTWGSSRDHADIAPLPSAWDRSSCFPSPFSSPATQPVGLLHILAWYDEIGFLNDRLLGGGLYTWHINLHITELMILGSHCIFFRAVWLFSIMDRCNKEITWHSPAQNWTNYQFITKFATLPQKIICGDFFFLIELLALVQYPNVDLMSNFILFQSTMCSNLNVERHHTIHCEY